MSIPAVQTYLAKVATKQVNKDFNTNLVIKKVDLSFLGSVGLKGVEIRDHHKDTLIFVNSLNTSILNARKLIKGEVDLGDLSLNGTRFYMKTYKGEKDDNMSVFLNSFEDNKPKDTLNYTPFILKTSNVYVENLTYKLIDENKKPELLFSATKAGGALQDFSLVGPNVSMKIRGLYFTENRGVEVTNLTTDFTYTKKEINLKNTLLQTIKSKVQGDIKMAYKREDFAQFTDKVKFTADFKKASLSVIDLKKFYDELSGDDVLNFTGRLKGTLNNFDVKKLNLRSKNGIKIRGDLSLINSFKTERGVIFDSKIKNVTANYGQLKSILPNVLGKTLPTEFRRLGTFSMNGNVYATPEKIDASLAVNSAVGNLISDLQLSNIDDIDHAKYSGEIEFENFDAGAFFKDPLFGEVSLKGDVKGSGFKVENINTSFIGEVSKMNFKGYDYTNLKVNGQYQNNKFNGDLIADDEHLKMSFNGLADLSQKKNKFDFKADIAHLDLKKTNLFTRDTTAVIKGNIDIDITGNTLDNINGKAVFENVIYANQNDTYKFKKFEIVSIVKDSLQTIKVNSKDIIEGQLSGKFLFEELLPVAQNALGSIYTNYTPYPVEPNQFINFNFTIYNKIVDVFLPEVSVGKNTKISGRINSNKQLLKLTVKAPELKAYGNELKKLVLRTDNQNSLYNSHLTADRITTKYYDFHKLNLLNRTKNDTLFFKSIFKGGKQEKESYNVDFFYTINPEQKSVVGLQKSNFNFKGNDWKVNPDKEFQNKITFNVSENDFVFSPFKLVSGNQKLEFSGALKGNEEKLLKAKFEKVKLTSILPQVDSLDLKGKLSGHVDFVQTQGLYEPKGTVIIEDFVINNFKQGDLSLNVEGDNSYEKYNVSLALQNKKSKSIAGNGTLDFSTKRPNIDFNVFMEEFHLDAFSPLGKDVLSNIRGEASGNFTLKGFLGNPRMNGSLILKDAGLKFPYLNTDYDFKGDAIIGLREQQFVLEDIALEDTKYKTKGRLLGSITHQNFNAWYFDLEIDTDNLLVLDTPETDEAIYYGTGYLDGAADIFGLADRLTIDINGKTMPGTKFIIPLKDVETVENFKLITFKKEVEEVVEKEKEIEAIKGLTLNVKLEVTNDAEAQVVIDKNTGSSLEGKGTGNLDIVIDSRGKFTMYGNFKVDEGKYDFKYGGVISKTFAVEKGGTITWSGNPFDANLDITAKYEARANPALLLDNFTSTTKIPIDLVVNITGGLFSSKQELDIKIPNVNSTVASELEFKLNNNNENEKNLQFVSLLALGNFINPDKLNFDGNQIVASTASNAISGALSNFLSSADGKVEFGLGYDAVNQSEVESINTGEQVNFSLGTKISDRVLFNGKVGVPVGTNNQASVVGEAKVEVLLNKEGTFRASVFNKPNEIQFDQQQEGYTQGVGLSYQVNFNNLKDLLRKIRNKSKKKKDTTALRKKKSIISFKKED